MIPKNAVMNNMLVCDTVNRRAGGIVSSRLVNNRETLESDDVGVKSVVIYTIVR